MSELLSDKLRRRRMEEEAREKGIELPQDFPLFNWEDTSGHRGDVPEEDASGFPLLDWGAPRKEKPKVETRTSSYPAFDWGDGSSKTSAATGVQEDLVVEAADIEEKERQYRGAGSKGNASKGLSSVFSKIKGMASGKDKASGSDTGRRDSAGGISESENDYRHVSAARRDDRADASGTAGAAGEWASMRTSGAAKEAGAVGFDGKELLSLFVTFAKVGVMTFGGGYAMLPILQREVVENKGWATDQELTDYFAIGQCTPGIIAVNTATFIGRKRAGVLGGILSTLGVVLPSLIIITILAGIIQRFAELEWVAHAFAGIRVCVCVLIFNSVLKLFKSAVIDAPTAILFAVIMLGASLLSVSPIVFVVIAAICGIVLHITGLEGKFPINDIGDRGGSGGAAENGKEGGNEVTTGEPGSARRKSTAEAGSDGFDGTEKVDKSSVIEDIFLREEGDDI